MKQAYAKFHNEGSAMNPIIAKILTAVAITVATELARVATQAATSREQP